VDRQEVHRRRAVCAAECRRLEYASAPA
jgi:hypothetical protein